MNRAMMEALKWLQEHNNEAAIARVKGGGRIFLSLGDTGPFLPSTARKLVDAGLARFLATPRRRMVRIELTQTGKDAKL